MKYESIEALAAGAVKLFGDGVAGEKLVVAPADGNAVELVHLFAGTPLGSCPIPEGETVASSAEALSALLGVEVKAPAGV